MNNNDTNYIIEFYSVGGSVKVTAIDPVTGTEATIIGPAKSTKKELTDLAVKKLLYVMNKNKPKEEGELV